MGEFEGRNERESSKYCNYIAISNTKEKYIKKLFNISQSHVFLPLYFWVTITPLTSSLVSPISQIHSSSISFQKRAGLHGISSEHEVIRYNKSRHKLSYQGWVRSSIRRKRVLRGGQSVRGNHAPTVRSFTKTLS